MKELEMKVETMRWGARLEIEAFKSTQIVSYSIHREIDGKPQSLEIWFEGNLGVDISTEPIEIEERTIAGVLCVNDALHGRRSQTAVAHDHWLNCERVISILRPRLKCLIVDSGLKISGNRSEIVVVASPAPCTLSLSGDLGFKESDFDTEYGISNYDVIPY
jgi:hypothetical protein